MILPKQIKFPIERIHAYCEEWNIQEFALFGSVLRSDFNENSDIDVLVTFKDNTHYTLFDLVKMENELELILGRKVDLVDRLAVEASANYIRRDEVLKSSEVIYATQR